MKLGLHPEATPDPQVVRWRYVDAPGPPRPGSVTIPGDWERLGVADVFSEDHAILVRLKDGVSWRERGGLMRSELAERLNSGGWDVVEAPKPAQLGEASDAEIERVAREVIARDIDALAGSHGGGVTLVGVRDGVVEVSLEGACDGCAAASMTLHRRFERALRRDVDGVVEVRAIESESCQPALSAGGRRHFLGWLHDRNRRNDD